MKEFYSSKLQSRIFSRAELKLGQGSWFGGTNKAVCENSVHLLGPKAGHRFSAESQWRNTRAPGPVMFPGWASCHIPTFLTIVCCLVSLGLVGENAPAPVTSAVRGTMATPLYLHCHIAWSLHQSTKTSPSPACLLEVASYFTFSNSCLYHPILIREQVFLWVSVSGSHPVLLSVIPGEGFEDHM